MASVYEQCSYAHVSIGFGLEPGSWSWTFRPDSPIRSTHRVVRPW